MPELAEVEFMRRRWVPFLGVTIRAVELRPAARIFRSGCAAALQRGLPGAPLSDSLRSGKRLLLACGPVGWIELHLGMTGELRVEPDAYPPAKHDHLLLRLDRCTLVMRDPRMFGSVAWHPGEAPPRGWLDRPPEILDATFSAELLRRILGRRPRSPLKALLLRQEYFPGIGNWMADEVLWQARLHPARLAASLAPGEQRTLLRALRKVCRGALRTVACGTADQSHWADPPEGWLFHQRWTNGGHCPATGKPLHRTTLAGRTTCWSPAIQQLS